MAVETFTVDSATQITAQISISSLSMPGPRNVSVTTPGGKGTKIAGFTVVGHPRWDVNQDGKVDYKDLAMLGAHYGETIAQPPYPAWDINQDGKVDYKDLAILGAHYGEVY